MCTCRVHRHHSTVAPWRPSSCVFLHSSVCLDVHVQYYIIGDLKWSDRSWEGDHRTEKGSQSASWFHRQSNQQPFRWHFQLLQHTSTLTTLQWRCIHHMTSAYSLWIITRSGLNAVPVYLWKWIDSMCIRCTSKRMRIRCEHAKLNSMHIKSDSKC